MTKPKSKTTDKPTDYVLVVLTVRRKDQYKGIYEKEIMGWWTGRRWDSGRLKEDDEVVRWKKFKGGYNCEYV